jgi:hypothetical protein
MKSLRILSLAAFASGLVWGADPRERNPHNDASPSEAAKRPVPALRLPRVLRSMEPKDSRVVMLPGAVLPRVPAPAAPSLAPALVTPGWRPMGVPTLPTPPDVAVPKPVTQLNAVRMLASVAPPPARATLAPLPVNFPGSRPAAANQAGLGQESALFCQREIGRWTLTEARAILGEPLRQRPAIDDDAVESGHIYAFRDPTSRYRELELDFGKDNGILRSVFVYPWKLTWQDCRKIWGVNVSATQGNKGRVFYSYVNRHLDVLVDHDGRVISLGLY